MMVDFHIMQNITKIFPKSLMIRFIKINININSVISQYPAKMILGSCLPDLLPVRFQIIEESNEWIKSESVKCEIG